MIYVEIVAIQWLTFTEALSALTLVETYIQPQLPSTNHCRRLPPTRWTSTLKMFICLTGQKAAAEVALVSCNSSISRNIEGRKLVIILRSLSEITQETCSESLKAPPSCSHIQASVSQTSREHEFISTVVASTLDSMKRFLKMEENQPLASSPILGPPCKSLPISGDGVIARQTRLATDQPGIQPLWRLEHHQRPLDQTPLL